MSDLSEVVNLEKMSTRVHDYWPLVDNHAERCRNWFTGAGLGLFVHWDHTSQQGIEISWPMVGGVFSLPG